MRFLALSLVLAASLPAMTMQLGRGLGPYRIGQQRSIHPGLIRTVRRPQNDAGGCSGGFQLDSYIDVYPGLKLGYIFTFARKTYLDSISTTRRGDRTSLGYTIGTTKLSEVRRRYPRLVLSRHPGGSTLTVVHKTGDETAAELRYSFDANDQLIGLFTGVGGC